MQLIEFPEQTLVIAKNQPEYVPMPAHRDVNGTVTCCWSLTWKERLRVAFTGTIWHQILTFNSLLQPQKLSIEKPKLEAAP